MPGARTSLPPDFYPLSLSTGRGGDRGGPQGRGRAATARAAFAVIIVSSIALCTASAAWADVIILKAAGNTQTRYDPVKIVNVSGGQIVFTFNSDRQISRDVQQVVEIQLDGNAAFNGAEDAFVAQHWDPAVDGYRRTLSSSPAEWVRDWAAFRLLIAANAANRFDDAAAAYAAVVRRYPAAAAPYKPQIPRDDRALNTAANTVEQELAAVAAESDTEAAQEQLLQFLLEIQQARQDPKAAADVATRLLKLHSSAPDTIANKALIDGRIAAANNDVLRGQFAEAQKIIHDDAPKIVDPAQQAEALFVLASAQQGLVKTKPNPVVQDWQDVALAYLRVAAHGKDQTANPRIPQAIYQAAAILESIHDPAALPLYRQLIDTYPTSTWATSANLAVSRLAATTRASTAP
jgi:tetratricopeptide (TPR) repeat protein